MIVGDTAEALTTSPQFLALYSRLARLGPAYLPLSVWGFLWPPEPAPLVDSIVQMCWGITTPSLGEDPKPATDGIGA